MAKTSSKNAGGRPANFSPEQVSDAIDLMLAEGHPVHEINGNTVKAMLVARFGATPGIREEAVEKVATQILEMRKKEENRELLKALPASVEPAVDAVLANMKRDLMLLIARENAVCVEAADKECQTLRADKLNANWRIADLEARGQEQGKELKMLAAARDDLAAELAQTRDEVRAAQAEIERRGREATTVDRLLTELRDPAVRSDLRAALAELVAAPAEPPGTS